VQWFHTLTPALLLLSTKAASAIWLIAIARARTWSGIQRCPQLRLGHCWASMTHSIISWSSRSTAFRGLSWIRSRPCSSTMIWLLWWRDHMRTSKPKNNLELHSLIRRERRGACENDSARLIYLSSYLISLFFIKKLLFVILIKKSYLIDLWFTAA